MTISAARAKQLAVDHYNRHFAGRLNFEHPATGACSSLPEIQVEHVSSAKLDTIDARRSRLRHD